MISAPPHPSNHHHYLKNEVITRDHVTAIWRVQAANSHRDGNLSSWIPGNNGGLAIMESLSFLTQGTCLSTKTKILKDEVKVYFLFAIYDKLHLFSFSSCVHL